MQTPVELITRSVHCSAMTPLGVDVLGIDPLSAVFALVAPTWTLPLELMPMEVPAAIAAPHQRVANGSPMVPPESSAPESTCIDPAAAQASTQVTPAALVSTA